MKSPVRHIRNSATHRYRISVFIAQCTVLGKNTLRGCCKIKGDSTASDNGIWDFLQIICNDNLRSSKQKW